MNEITTNTIFETIKPIDENGNEYWYARELMPLLEYSKWERFNNIINNAKRSCVKSGYNVTDHFPEVGKMVEIGSKTKRNIIEYKLSRYACYLIAQTDAKLKRDNVDNEYNANSIDYEVGKIVRKVIKEAGGTMLEDLPTPNRSIKEIEKTNKNKRLKCLAKKLHI